MVHTRALCPAPCSITSVASATAVATAKEKLLSSALDPGGGGPVKTKVVVAAKKASPKAGEGGALGDAPKTVVAKKKVVVAVKK